MKSRKLLAVGAGIVLVASIILSTLGAWAQTENPPAKPEWMQKVSPNLVAAVEAAAGDNDGAFIVEFDEQPDLTPAYQMDWESRGWWVYNTLDAARAQRQEALKAVGLTGVCFMSTPVCQVGGGMSEVEVAAKMKQVSYVRAPEIFQVDPVTQEEAKQEIQAVEWGIAKIRADQVWSLEVNGTDVVVANIDTGVDYTHPALVGNYRGTITGSHDYSWYDPANICPNPQVPCDNNSHGTHTMGTIAGGLGIGVAPGATWIAAKGCESSGCSEFALNSAADWILAPRKTDGSNPNPSMRPQLVSNSWGGGRGDTWYASKVDAWLAAGIIPVFSAGNSGPACETANDPGEYPNVISAGATDSADGIAFFSSRGPRSSGGIGPDLSAPGVGVRSSVPGGGYSEYSGTSMAAPHVAGAIALVLSANPGLMGNFEAVRAVLTGSATPLATSETCGGIPAGSVPNNTFGAGRLDVYQAVVDVGGGHTGWVAGKVANSLTGAPVEGATVTVSGAFSSTVRTGTDGAYSFQLALGLYTMEVEAWTYVSQGATVQVAENATSKVDFNLSQSPVYELTGVVLARKTGNADWLRQAGAKVTLVAGAPFTMTVSTGGADFEKGVFHFYDLPAGQYRLKAETGFCSGAAGQEFTVTVPSPGSANVINLEDKVSYSGLPGNFAWQDIKTIGRRLNISTVDDGWEPVNLVLPFPYWNNSINTIGVSSNGFVMTDLRNAQAVGSDYYPHLGDSESAGVIAPYWGDLRPGMVVTDGVWLLDGPDWFVLQWAAWEWPGTSDRPWREFQLMGLKGNGTIRFFYKDSPAGGAPWAIGVQGGLGELVKWWGTQPVSGSGIEFTRITEGCHTEQVYLPAIHRGIDNPPPGGDPTPTPYPASATPEP